MPKLMKTPENLEQKQAYEYYYTLGTERNLRKVAQKFNKSLTTIHKWNKSYNWQERVEIRDAENARRLEQANNDAIVEIKAKYHKIIKAVISKFVEDFQANKVKIRHVKDLERLMRLDLELLGEEGKRSEGYIDELNRAVKTGMIMAGIQPEHTTYDELGMEFEGEEELEELDYDEDGEELEDE